MTNINYMNYWNDLQIEGYSLVCYQTKYLPFWGNAIRAVYIDKKGHWFRESFLDVGYKITKVLIDSFVPFDTDELKYPGWIYVDRNKI